MQKNDQEGYSKLLIVTTSWKGIRIGGRKKKKELFNIYVTYLHICKIFVRIYFLYKYFKIYINICNDTLIKAIMFIIENPEYSEKENKN